MKLVLFTLVLFTAALARGQDAEQGRVLYETYCGGCHYERVHQRPPERRQVKSLANLRDTVARWAPQAARKLTLDEREAIVQYLNRSHYRLEN
jgi:mono/diheme cytochrome c family protein